MLHLLEGYFPRYPVLRADKVALCLSERGDLSILRHKVDLKAGDPSHPTWKHKNIQISDSQGWSLAGPGSKMRSGKQSLDLGRIGLLHQEEKMPRSMI